MVFELPLTEEKVKPHQVTALHLLTGLAFTGAGAIFYMVYPPAKIWSVALSAAGICLLLLSMFRNKWITEPKTNRIFRIAELIVLLSLAGFSARNKWTPPAVMFGILSATVLFSLFWEQGKGNLSIQINSAGVTLPANGRKRLIPWEDIEHILIKFGTLTINCYDNRLFQWTIGNINIDKAAFDTFCTAQIDEAKKTRVTTDW